VLEGRAESISFDKRYVRADGHCVWVRVSTSLVRDAEGRPVNFVSQIEDIRDRRRAEERLKDLADHDSLTGLLNRRRFDEELRTVVQRLRRYGGRAALLLLDVDRFKAVNDTHGHKAGDDVLVEVGAALRRRLRATDVVGRLGGDEFGVLLLETGADESRLVALELAGAIRNGGGPIVVTASIGVVLLDERASADADDALVAADRALYAAKSAGRDCVVLAS
jgi:diguanylate cyclase (GGDEF)-like protein